MDNRISIGPAASPAPTAAAVPSAEAAKGNGAASSAAANGQAGGSTSKTAFKDALNQANKSAAQTDTASPSSDSTVAEPVAKGETATDSSQAVDANLIAILLGGAGLTNRPDRENLISLIQEALDNSDKVAELLNTLDGQAWLTQADALLQALNVDPNSDTAGSSTSLPVTAKVESVLSGLLTALQTEPETVLPVQLAEGFAKLLAAQQKDSEPTVEAKPAADSNAQPSSPEQGEVQVAVKVTKSAHSALEALTFRKGLHPEQMQALAADSAALSSEEPAPAVTLAQPVATSATVQKEEAQPGTAALVSGAKEEPVSPDAQPILAASLKSSAAELLKPDKLEIPVQVRNFADEMASLLAKNSKTGILGNLTEARLLLRPEHLGAVDVRITLHNGQLVAHFAAQQSLAKDVLENQMTQLRVTLQNQGYQVERLEVTHSPSLQSGMFQGDQGRQAFRQTKENSQGNRSHVVDLTEEEFEAQLDHVDELRRDAAGATVDFTA
ncbi:flagellar hook-length control protein FliK [Gorillibacterium sp. CAU 1737]|uniref:flagellar hook-length control protein FliK n=1 Tax=Gorillibacterium sp. CAU 1737 TaxID=3140362 RepID=UPI0032618BB4